MANSAADLEDPTAISALTTGREDKCRSGFGQVGGGW